MKKLVVLGMGLCFVMAFTSCKSSESAYKKAYEKAKQQELAQEQTEETVTPIAIEAPVTVVESTPVAVAPVTEEKVELVSGDGLKAFSVVCGSFGVKANADSLKERLDAEGYSAKVVYNATANNGNGMYRVIAASYDDRAQATQAREDFKARHSDNPDFQKAWLLYRVY